MKLNETEQDAIVCALRLAAHKYVENAAYLRRTYVCAHRNDIQRLAAQFDRQAVEAIAIAETVENAEVVECRP